MRENLTFLREKRGYIAFKLSLATLKTMTPLRNRIYIEFPVEDIYGSN